MSWIKKHWWKGLGVLILLYTFTAGLLVPLKTGIEMVAPQSLVAGRNWSLRVYGYNTDYKAATGQIRAWLKMDDDHVLAAHTILVHSEREMKMLFFIPAYLPTQAKVTPFSLIIDDPVNGAQVLPSAVFVTQSFYNQELADLQWPPERITDLHVQKGFSFPFRNILKETIRNTYYHVPLWFAMILLFMGSVFYSGRYLMRKDTADDHQALSLIRVGVLFGVLGLVTGAIWAKNTWGQYWSGDIKQNMTAICLLIYMAYFVLRAAYEDPDQRARVGAVYSVFAFVAMIPLLFVIPRLTDSLHPGNGGNPALGGEDLDNTMRLVFYPAIIGWFLMGLWMARLSYRMERLKEHLWERELG